MPDDDDCDYEYAGDDGHIPFDPADECGRWINGNLGQYCTKAGSEECDWECPYSR
jgi:hypothetical protein